MDYGMMLRLSDPTCCSGAWLLTLLTFTSALPSRLDVISLRSRWKGVVTNATVSRQDYARDSPCPLNCATWPHPTVGPSPTKPSPYASLSNSNVKSLHTVTRFKANEKYLVKERVRRDTASFSQLREIHSRMLLLKKEKGNLLPSDQSPSSDSKLRQLSPLESAKPTLLQTPRKRYMRKGFAHGREDRKRIMPIWLRKFPYSNMVRLSTGCTGTLVTPLHVLTAAHCVHNGHGFRNKLEMLKVEVPDTIRGVRVYYIEKIGIPEKWLNPQSRSEWQAFYDYAVVRLSSGVHGRSKFLPLAVPSQEILHQSLQFLGFPLDSLGLWRSVCSAKSNKALMDGNLILTQCDSTVGNSGAAVLAKDYGYGRKIIGVLSSTMHIGRTPFLARYNIVAAFTWSKLHDICAEIGPIGVDYGVCPSSQLISKSRRFQNNNRVIPFFG